VENLVNDTATFEEVFEVLGGFQDGGLFECQLLFFGCTAAHRLIN
jgi:hypothetical protein